LTVRQTNIVWVAFFTATSVLEAIRQKEVERVKRDVEEDERITGVEGRLGFSDPLLTDTRLVGMLLHE
jgi:hypothetical protein